MKRLIGYVKIPVILAIFLAGSGIMCAYAANKDKKEAKIEIEKLTLFKNGLGFIVSIAALPEGTSDVRIGQLPIPSFGTFWVSYPKNVRLINLTTSMEGQEQKIPAQSIGQLLRLNAGRKVLIHTGDRDIEGVVIDNTVDKETGSKPGQYYMSGRPPQDPYGRAVQPMYTSDMLLIKTDKGVTAINQSSVIRAEFTGSDPVSVAEVKQNCPSIEMNLERPAGGEKVVVSYLARGVTWSPSYLVDLSDPKTAKFSAHALIINEMTDFKNVKLQLVTGFPNIKFGEILNPIAKSQSLAQFISALTGARNEYQRGNYMAQQAMVSNVMLRYEGEEPSVVPDYSTAADGLVAEDLFFYPVKEFSLKRDETAWLPLFTAEMPYKHVYTWQIDDMIDKEERYRSGGGSQPPEAAEEVWHSCRLTNNLSMPLTTAATEFITNGEFTGQDVCYYTPPKKETTIRINKALNVLAEQAEIEVDRKRDATTIHGYRYDLVKMRGELRIKNKIDKTVNMEITKELSGDVLESAPKAKDVKTAKGLKRVNPKHVLKWEIDLGSGEEQKLTYQYQVFIRE